MKTRVIVFIILSAFFFGTMEVMLKIAGSNLDALQTTFWRFLIGGIFLAPFGVAERRKMAEKITGKQYLYLLLLGIICIPIAMVLFQYGVMNSNASTAAVIFSINPLFTMLFAHFMTKNDKLNKAKGLSLLIGLCGIFMMIRPWDIQPGNTIYGVMLSVGAALVFGLYSVMGSITIHRIGVFAQTSISFIFGAGVLLVVLLVTGRPVFDGVVDNIMLVMYLSIFVTGAGYLFYFMSMKYSNATTGSIVFFLKPVIAPVIAVIVLHEAITWNMYIGIGLILVASLVMIREKRKGVVIEINDHESLV